MSCSPCVMKLALHLVVLILALPPMAYGDDDVPLTQLHERIARRCQEALWQRSPNSSKAERMLGRLVQQYPSEYQPFLAMGLLCEDEQRHQEALHWYSEALKRDPMLLAAYKRRAQTHSKIGEYGKAHADYECGIILASNSDHAFLSSFAWHLATCPEGRYRSGSRAVKYAGAAVKETGGPYSPYYDTIAASYAEQGHFNQAVMWLEKSMQYSLCTDEMMARLALYRQRKPYREAAFAPNVVDKPPAISSPAPSRSNRPSNDQLPLFKPKPEAPLDMPGPNAEQNAGTHPSQTWRTEEPVSRNATFRLLGFSIGLVAFSLLILAIRNRYSRRAAELTPATPFVEQCVPPLPVRLAPEPIIPPLTPEEAIRLRMAGQRVNW